MNASHASPPRRYARLAGVLSACVLFAALIGAPSASADFGISAFDADITNEAGTPYTQAAGHPYQASNSIEFNAHVNDFGLRESDESVKEAVIDLPAGLVGNTTAVARCSLAQLVQNDGDKNLSSGLCPIGSIIGVSYINSGGAELPPAALFNMEPQGAVTRWGISVLGNVIVYDAQLRSDGDYGVSIHVRNVSQTLPLVGNRVVIWGTPGDASHDSERCRALLLTGCNGEFGNPKSGPNSFGAPPVPYVTSPTRCTASEEGLQFKAAIESWFNPGTWAEDDVFTHEPPGFPEPEESWGPQRGTDGCNLVSFDPTIKVTPTTQSASSPTGLNVELSVPDDGFLNPKGISQAILKDSEVTLPEGITINPSAGEGLGVCTPAQYAAETETSAPGAGCPDESKIGSVRIDTPALAEPINGSLYIAQQNNNPFNSLLAMYVVTRVRDLGLMIKIAGKIEPDPKTGQLVTTFEDDPQLPFSKFTLSFREGARSPLVTPPACGTYTTEAKLSPWSAVDPENPTPSEIVTATSDFQITHGVGGGPCPSGGLPPFKPGLIAGSLNNAAGRFSPFNVRLFRTDQEQEITHFSIKLPPGLIGKLAGVPFCPDAAIEASKARTGAQEIASPSCPAASEVGRTLAGAGVGAVLTYAPGKIYLAGPYHGSALSIAAITAAKVGPFDLGTVVVRQALKIDPETAEVFIDATGSDPIPHIIDGITTHLRDIRAYVDKPNFTLNPTDCDRTSTASTLLGSGLNFASEADDNPVTVSSPFQAADCAALPFKPKLSLKLLGGTKRGAHPAFRANLKMKGIGEAAIERAQVTLPHSEFLENSHIKTICTRVQFNQGAYPGQNCPARSIYGYAKAITPLLDEPLAGPVFLRSSEHKLPDLVAALHNGKININLVGRIDSVKGGGIRNTFESVPDAPVTEFTLTMQGGKKGLLVNSTNLCKGTHKAEVNFDAHNGKVSDTRPALQAKCAKKSKRAARHKRAAR
jgi:hypothetical protein